MPTQVRIIGVDKAAGLLDDLQEGLDRPPRELLQQVGESWRGIFDDHFATKSSPFGPWKPRSAAREAIDPSGRTMQSSGNLRGAIKILSVDDEEVRVGFSGRYFYGIVQQFGGRTGKGRPGEKRKKGRDRRGPSAIPGVRIPSRPFIILGDDDFERTVEEVVTYFLGEERETE